MNTLQETRDTLAAAMRLLDRIDDLRVFSPRDDLLPERIARDVETFILQHPKGRWPR